MLNEASILKKIDCPSRLNSNLIDECCKDVNNHTILFNCVNTTLSNHKSQNSNVVMAIFASKNTIGSPIAFPGNKVARESSAVRGLPSLSKTL